MPTRGKSGLIVAESRRRALCGDTEEDFLYHRIATNGSVSHLCPREISRQQNQQQNDNV
jgi:hypothetical protein